MPQCPTCGSNVSEQADVCPDCGMDLNQTAPAPAENPPGDSIPVEISSADAPPEVELPGEAAPLETSPVPPPPDAGRATLTLKRAGALTGDRFAFAGRVVLGRFDPESGPVDVDLGPLPEAAYVSRHHAEVWLDESGQWHIRDLGSRNGTFVRSVNGQTFERATDAQPIQDGDEIALGNARFEFHTV